jgi:hypothetical protein
MFVGITFIATFLFGVVIAFGVLLLTAGIIGTPVPCPPCCARCRHGVAVASGHIHSPCPECAADLTAVDGIRYFRRQARGSRIAAGIGVCFAAFAVPILLRLVMFAVSNAGSGANLSAAELAALIADPTEDVFLSINEATNRAGAGTLSDADLKAIVTAIRSRRAGEKGAYPFSAETDLVALADQRKLLSDEELTAYLRSTVSTPKLDIPSTIRVPFTRGLSAPSGDSFNSVTRQIAVKRIEIDGVPLALLGMENKPIERFATGSWATLTIDVPPGDYALRITFEETYGVAVGNSPGPPPTRLIVDRIEEQPIRVVAANDPTWIELTTPSERRQDVASACVATAIAIDRDASGAGCSLRAAYRLHAVEGLTLAFDIVAEIAGAEHLVGRHVVASRGGSTTEWPALTGPVALGLPNDPLPREATIIFRPNPSLAEGLLGVSDIWGESVRIERVPIVTTLTQQPEGQRSSP